MFCKKKLEYLEEDLPGEKNIIKKDNSFLSDINDNDNHNKVKIDFEKINNKSINLNINVSREVLNEYKQNNNIIFSVNLTKSVLLEIIKMLK